ncbi:MAG: tandem-95 repeat protein [Deltaproteobacteria bacterium]|nr:tandem-95 repeat protein [Deltaproteobacteria bacterium]
MAKQSFFTSSPVVLLYAVTFMALTAPKAWAVIEISDLAGLQAMNNDLTADYVLTADIDASDTATWNGGAGFDPIGDGVNLFTGTFDGQGHEISGLHINRPSENFVGLLAYTNAGFEMKNVGLTDVHITGNQYVGGLVGYNYIGTITDCYSTGSVSGAGYTGGLAGYNNGGTITSCYSTGSVSNASGYVGGLVGGNGGTITTCYSTGSVSGANRVGGLVGDNGGTITSCYSTGSVSGAGYVGGLLGSNMTGTYTDCYWDTETSGTGTGVGNSIVTGVTGRTTAEMKQQATFTGWDFPNTWRIAEDTSYPYLPWQVPVAADNGYTTWEDTELTIVAPGVLDNDTDRDNDTLTAILVDSPANGSIVLNDNGSFTFTPDTGFLGTASFTYKAYDGTCNSTSATVEIDVVNKPPVAFDDGYATEMSTTTYRAAPGVLENDTDAVNDTLTAILQDGPDNGTLSLLNDGSFFYAPDPGFIGTDSFTYMATDGFDNSTPATVEITVSKVADPVPNPGGGSSGGGGGGGGGGNRPPVTLPPESLQVLGLVDFEDRAFVKVFDITNAADTGSLQWTIGEPLYVADTGWIGSIMPSSGTTSDSSEVTMSVSRQGLAPGVYEAVLPVTSNSGETEISVVMEVTADPVPALDTSELDLGLIATEAVFNVANLGGGELSCSSAVTYQDGDGWLSLNGDAGLLGQGETASMTVFADRTGLDPGLYEALITISSGFGTEEITVRMAVQGSGRAQLSVDPRLCMFLTAAKTVDAVVVENRGTAPLKWSVGEVNYGLLPDGWLGIDFEGSILDSGEHEFIGLTVDRTGLVPGLYLARIPLISDDGRDSSLLVIMYVPLFNRQAAGGRY